jgi:hypothetical protein
LIKVHPLPPISGYLETGRLKMSHINKNCKPLGDFIGAMLSKCLCFSSR